MGTFYAPNDYRNYIAHYGVKGMKWGVRKQSTTGESSSRTRRPDGIGTRISKRVRKFNRSVRKGIYDTAVDYDRVKNLQRKKLALNAPIDTKIDQILRTRKANHGYGKLSESVGSGAARTAYENKARYHEEMAKTFRSERRRKEQERLARNARSLAEAYDKSAQIYLKGGNEAFKRSIRNSIVNPDVLTATYERRNGKKITQGRHMVEEAAIDAAKQTAIRLAKQYIRNKYSRR